MWHHVSRHAVCQTDPTSVSSGKKKCPSTVRCFPLFWLLSGTLNFYEIWVLTINFKIVWEFYINPLLYNWSEDFIHMKFLNAVAALNIHWEAKEDAAPRWGYATGYQLIYSSVEANRENKGREQLLQPWWQRERALISCAGCDPGLPCTVPQGYCRALTILFPILTSSVLPTTANGKWLCGKEVESRFYKSHTQNKTKKWHGFKPTWNFLRIAQLYMTHQEHP